MAIGTHGMTATSFDLAPSYLDEIGTVADLLATSAIARGPVTALAELDGTLLTANYADDTIALLAPQSLREIAEVTEIYEPTAIVVDRSRAYVASVEPAYDTITVLEHSTVIARIPINANIRDLAISVDGKRVYAAVVSDAGAALAVIDARTHAVNMIDLVVGMAVPSAVGVGGNGVVYVATADQADDTIGRLLAVSGNRVIGNLRVPSPIRDIAVTREAVFVARDDAQIGGLVDIIDIRRFVSVHSVELGGAVTQMSVSADGARVYVSNGARVIVLNVANAQIIDRIEVDEAPAAVLESRDGSRLFVADHHGRVSALAAHWVGDGLGHSVAEQFDFIDIAPRELEAAGV